MMTEPTLLLSADGSRDRDGAVVPTVGENVSVVAGAHGQAWQRNSDTNGIVQIATSEYLAATAGTVLARMTAPIVEPTVTHYALATNSGAFRLLLYRETTTTNPNRPRFGIGNPLTIVNANPNSAPGDTLVTYGMSWSGGTATAYLDGSPVTTFAYTQGAGTPSTIFTSLTGSGTGQKWEGALCYDIDLSDGDIATLSAMDAAWTWDGVIAALTPTRTLHPVLKIGTNQRIGPLRVGERT